MPQTRNVTRARLSAEQRSSTVTRSTTTRRKRNENAAAEEEEKENIGRQTAVSSLRRRSGVLGSNTSTLGVFNAVPKASTRNKAASKGKAKVARPKVKKMPLQDITSQFLPAPESANRGASFEDGDGSNLQELLEPITTTMASSELGPVGPPVFMSPLPPSSPPSASTPSPFKSAYPMFDPFLDEQTHDPLVFDDVQPDFEKSSSRSNSDPFGFTAVERKLKEEREIAATISRTHEEAPEDICEDLDDIPVADTSSPRPVPRLKRSHTCELIKPPSDSEERQETTNDAPPFVLLPPPHLATPPTPQKDKHDRRRFSHEGHDIFSPCSSLESSPSPTKTSATKRPRDVQIWQDPLDEFNEEVEKSRSHDAIVETLPPSKRQRQIIATEQAEQSPIKRVLRPRRRVAESEKAEVVETQKRVKDKSSKKPVGKPLSSKKVINDSNESEDLDEKWQRERQERVKYFERLAEYEVEKEDIYII